MKKSFYSGKKILITGHTGFKGSWLSIWLNYLGADVIGYALDPISDKCNFSLSNIKERIIDIRGDIRDENQLKTIFDQYQPEIVFHLAAQPLVRRSYEYPKETYDVNIMGTINVLECIRKSSSVKCAVMVTSDKCYENKDQLWGYRECDALGGYDPYSASKGCCEIVINSYRSSYFNKKDYIVHGKAVASARAGNVIGGGDWAEDRLVPDCIRSIENAEAIQIRSPKAIRPWQHVLEPLSGYLLLAQKLYEIPLVYSDSWNFGPNIDSCICVENLALSVIREMGTGTLNSAIESASYHEAKQLSLDITKAVSLLGWSPKWDVETTIKHTVEWYKNYKDKDVYKMCIEQIDEFGE